MPLARLMPIVCLAVATAALAQTQPAGRRQHARASLVADAKTIVADKPFTVAVAFEMDPTWHVYWKDPGDSGMPPSIKWTLPPGFTAGEIQWPKPETLDLGPAGINYVYHDKVALLVEITPDPQIAVASAVTIAADIKWLECDKDQCLPAKQSTSVSLTVGHTVEPSDPAQFDAWRKAVADGATFEPKKSAK